MVPTSPGGAAFGAMAPTIKPLNKTAPAPNDTPAIEICPSAYPRAIARNSASKGEDSSKVRTTSIIGILSSCATARLPELSQDTRYQVRGGRRMIKELVGEPHGFPFESAHLMERKDLDPFDVAHRRYEPG